MNQDNCQHLNQSIRYETVGKYDRLKWTDYTCADCGKRWRKIGVRGEKKEYPTNKREAVHP